MKSFYSETGGMNDIGRSLSQEICSVLDPLIKELHIRFPDVESREIEYIFGSDVNASFACYRLSTAVKLHKKKKMNK